MNNAQIRSRLKTLLGPRAMWETKMTNPDAHGRAEWSEKADALKVESDAADAARKARYEKLMQDPEYIELAAKATAVKRQYNNARSMARAYPISAGNSMAGLFFSVLAQGDTWPEVFKILEAKKAAGRLF